MTNRELKQSLIDLGICKNNKYLSKYVKLIISNLNTKKQLGYDKHHIIPKHYYNYNKLKINNNKENLVYLSRSDHILAHLYLCFCCTLEYYIYSNSYAVVMFIHSNYMSYTYKECKKYITYDLEEFILLHKNEINKAAKIFSKLQRKRNLGKKQSIESIQKRIQTIKKMCGIKPNLNKTGLVYNGNYHLVPNEDVNDYLEKGAILGRWPVSEESKEKNRKAHLRKPLPHTKEWNDAIAKSNKGRKQTDECKQKISNTLKGCNSSIKGKIAINNGQIYKYVFEQDYIDNYQSQGWIRGIGNLSKSYTSVKNKIRINNEFGAKYVTLEEWENKYSKEGWHRGYDWKK